MVELKSIQIDGNIVKCDIFPEDSKENGYIEVDVPENKIVNSSLPTGYEWCKNHLEHARRFIVENFACIRDMPIKDKTIMWY